MSILNLERISYANKSPKAESSLKRLDDIHVNRILLSVQEISLGTVLVMKYGDGVIEFRDRTSMEVISRDETRNQVSSLSQVGFKFPDIGSCEWILNRSLGMSLTVIRFA